LPTRPLPVSEDNVSSQSQTPPFDAQMTGTNGSTYEVSTDPSAATNAEDQFLGANYNAQSGVNPGTTYQDVFVWDVPTSVRAASVTIDSSYDDPDNGPTGTVNVRS
jgi:hypothetical protein